MRVEISGPRLAVETCCRRLTAAGSGAVAEAHPELVPEGGMHLARVDLDCGGQAAQSVECHIAWHGEEDAGEGNSGWSEALVQARSGLMRVHSRGRREPERIGLEVASVASGVLAAQGVLATAKARESGLLIGAVDTSVMQAALLLESHFIARAGCGDDAEDDLPISVDGGPGPPFPTADGRWVEVETLDPEAWKSFWSALGVEPRDISRAWVPFASRYWSTSWSLPQAFHEATGKHDLRYLEQVAVNFGLSFMALRRCEEVLLSPGLTGREQPTLASRPSPDGGRRRDSEHSPHASVLPALPLEGILVVEATSRLQGPLAGLLLAMLGARVIRVEPPGGDPTRMIPPIAGDTGAFFGALNRGKEPVEIDLRQEGGRAELREIVRTADVFLHNWRPGRAAEWGLEFDDLVRVNPKLVYCAASGWGDMAPSCPPLGMEFLVQAYAGMGYSTNPADCSPRPSRVLLVDFMGGMVGCEGVLRALSRRRGDRCGQRVETSLLAGAMTLQMHVLEAMAKGEERERSQGRPLWGALDHPIETKEGFLLVSVEGSANFAQLCGACDVDPGAGTAAEVERVVCQRMRDRAAEEWREILLGAGVPCAVVCVDLASLTRDPLIGHLLEPMASTWVARSPWQFRS